MKAAVEAKLEELEQAEIIAQVDVPTPWISNLTAVWKASGKQVCVCLDPRELNKAIKRRMPTLDDVLPQLAGAKVFSLLDAKDGFNQVVLSEKSSYLTTFWGPQRRYRWRCLPFGLSSAPEEFQRRLQAVMHGLSGVVVVADDILIFGKGQTMEEARSDHNKVLLKVFQKLRQSNLKLNKEKMRLYFSELLYIGHHISAEGIKPDQAKVTAIHQMPSLRSVQDVRFLGMCNYLSRFLPKLSQISEPLRRLLDKEEEFRWGEEEQHSFKMLKDLICREQLLTYYDVKKPVVIQCDASTEGLSATLLQEGKPVISVSWSLSKAEKNYVALELECLVIVFACRKFDQYIYGKDVVVETDHKPLEVITKRSLLVAPHRLQRMLLQLQRYNLTVVYWPGCQQVIADTLSHLPVEEVPSRDELSTQEVFQLESENLVCRENWQ